MLARKSDSFIVAVKHRRKRVEPRDEQLQDEFKKH